MISTRHSSLILIAILFSSGLYAQKPFMGKEPSWVVKAPIDYSLSKFPAGSEDGYMDLSVEKQIDLGSQCVYHKKSIKIITESGVQNGSEISVVYDPSYERLIFHDIHILRDGRIINKLDLSKIRTVKEETELSRSVYNGTVSSVLFLEDTRKGDIIEYSYSLTGFNPVFKNKYSDFLSAGFAVPLGHLLYRIICPAGRKLYIKNDQTELNPVVTGSGDDHIYQWEFNNLPAVESQDELPSWYDPYPSVMVGEYASWNEICRWAMPLFKIGVPLSGTLKEKIAELRSQAGSDSVKMILGALRFVQDEIRYQGIEMGVNSHKPNGPDKVIAQRFGDCKDKSYLLCTILQQFGIDAAPVLINTTYQDKIAGWLPSPLDFNHATVRVRLGNKNYWFDPTISLQRGGIDDISFPDYKCGLVLTDTGSALTMIPLQDPGEVIAKENFVLEDHYGEAVLKVVTRYTGSFADEVRDQLNSGSKTEMQKSYQSFYNEYYSGIKSSDSLIIEDDEKTGMITTREAYKIDKLWEVTNGAGKASFYGLLINSIVKKPRDQDRKMPVAQTYPAHYTEELEINVPENWTFDKATADIHSQAFTYTSDINATDRTVTIKYEYRALKDHISVQDAAGFFTDYEKLKKDLGYELTKGGTSNALDPAPYTGERNSNLLKGLVCILLIVGITYSIRRRK